MSAAARLTGALACLSLCSAPQVSAQVARAPSWHIHATPHYEIFYQSTERDDVEAVARSAERAYARISFSLKYDVPEKIPLILLRADRDLPRNVAQATALVIASGAPERHHLLVSLETFARQTDSVSHELTHLFLFDLLPHGAPNAAWVPEGLSDQQAGFWESSELAKLRDALANDRVPAVESLTASDRHWGHAVFDFVAAEYGARGIRQYLAALRGSPLSGGDAIRAAFGVPAADFNAAFKSYVSSRVR